MTVLEKLSQDYKSEVIIYWCMLNSQEMILSEPLTMLTFKLVLLMLLMEVFQDLLMKLKVIKVVVQPADVTHAKVHAH